MSSVYFPAHVVALIRRLVNVVSTLSISNQYISRSQAGKPDDTPSIVNTVNSLKLAGLQPLQQPPDPLENGKWRPWTLIDSRDGVREAHMVRSASHLGMLLNATLDLPKWMPGNWSLPRLFSFQPQLDGPSPEHDPPPRTPRESPRKDKDSSGSNKDTRQRSPKRPYEPPQPQRPHPPDIIHQLLVNPALYDPLRTPRFPIVLCHGLYGFDSRGPSSFPSMRMHYWSNVLRVLRGQIGAEVIVTSVPGTGSIPSRAAKLDEQLKIHARGRGINFLAHSMGGLDCRHLISNMRPKEYAPLSLTSISTPHRGSPFMDWCTSNIGIGKLRQQEKELKEELRASSRRGLGLSSFEHEDDYDDYSSGASSYSSSESRSASTSRVNLNSKSGETSSFSLASLPSSFTTLILGIVDSPAYANLTSHYLNEVFNPATPDDPRVKYFSVAGRLSRKSVSIWHPFWLPKMVLDGAEESEREKLKKLWEEQYSEKEWKEADGVPLWADEREWGNDGLVTVQSAKWGEFLGTMEGCDHWEMRGARGIELGVDLPAIPLIGLGSSPASTSTNIRESGVSQPTQAQGDGWGFGDWTRFVGAWMKNKDDVAAAKMEKESEPSSPSPNKTESSVLSKTPTKDETLKQKQERELAVVDEAIKSSTDKLSVVFDWLIERVPAPADILRVSSDVKGKAKATAADAEKEGSLRAAAVTYRVGVGSNSNSASADRSGTPSSAHVPSSPPSEMKQRMDREDSGRKKNELGSKEDLERFYVALARKMYDAGL